MKSNSKKLFCLNNLNTCKALLIFICIALFTNNVHANDSTFHKERKNAIYAESFGNGMLGSLNYERYFKVKRQLCTVSLGCFVLPITVDRTYSFHTVFVPIRFNFVFGTKHQYLPGIGLTYESGSITSFKPNTYLDEFKKYSGWYLMLSPIKYQYSFYKSKYFVGAQAGWFYRLFLMEGKKIINDQISVYKHRPFVGLYLGRRF
jgi:hypothetical protein